MKIRIVYLDAGSDKTSVPDCYRFVLRNRDKIIIDVGICAKLNRRKIASCFKMNTARKKKWGREVTEFNVVLKFDHPSPHHQGRLNQFGFAYYLIRRQRAVKRYPHPLD